eukprot:scaffold243321_cov46-Attheya_sp.AAC.1
MVCSNSTFVPSLSPSNDPSMNSSGSSSDYPSTAPTEVPRTASPNFVSGPRMESRKIANLTEVWETVQLTGFTSPIPICSVEYPTSNSNYFQPVLVRMRNVISRSFQIHLQEPIKPSEIFTGFEQDVMPLSVHCLIVEKGTWKLPDNRTIFAESYTSTVTDRMASWTGEDQTASISSLVGPIVVLGQIMTYNDMGYSAFWSRDDDTNTPQTLTRIRELFNSDPRTSHMPPSTGRFIVGKHVGKDPQTS